jgi:hypothetical protein
MRRTIIGIVAVLLLALGGALPVQAADPSKVVHTCVLTGTFRDYRLTWGTIYNFGGSGACATGNTLPVARIELGATRWCDPADPTCAINAPAFLVRVRSHTPVSHAARNQTQKWELLAGDAAPKTLPVPGVGVFEVFRTRLSDPFTFEQAARNGSANIVFHNERTTVLERCGSDGCDVFINTPITITLVTVLP